MKQYLDLLQDVLDNGVNRTNRSGVFARSVFGRVVRYDLTKGFPLLTTREIFFEEIVHELLWFIKGDSNVRYLQEHGVHTWDQWADKDGNLGPVYGKQWRDFGGGSFYDDDGYLLPGVDQLQELVNKLKINPNSHRLIVSAWNPMQLLDVKQIPRQVMFQCYVAKNKLSLLMYQRSCDVFRDVPSNVASYALLAFMLAKVCGYKPGEFIHMMGDTYLYRSYLNQVREQLRRKPFSLPKLHLNPAVRKLEDFRCDDIRLSGYVSHPAIEVPAIM